MHFAARDGHHWVSIYTFRVFFAQNLKELRKLFLSILSPMILTKTIFEDNYQTISFIGGKNNFGLYLLVRVKIQHCPRQFKYHERGKTGGHKLQHFHFPCQTLSLCLPAAISHNRPFDLPCHKIRVFRQILRC